MLSLSICAVVLEGRVRKWRSSWDKVAKGPKPTGVQNETTNDTRLEILRWVATNDISEQPTGPRHPHLRPVSAELQAYMLANLKAAADNSFALTIRTHYAHIQVRDPRNQAVIKQVGFGHQPYPAAPSGQAQPLPMAQ
jgi:hypothetical protein